LSQLPAETDKRGRSDMIAFVTAHQGSENTAEVAKKLGIKEASAAARASSYRNGKLEEDGVTWAVKPIALKKFTRNGGGGSKLDPDAANKLIESLGTTNVAEEVAKLQAAKLARIAKAAEKAAETVEGEVEKSEETATE
jgi:hypothetical protein